MDQILQAVFEGIAENHQHNINEQIQRVFAPKPTCLNSFVSLKHSEALNSDGTSSLASILNLPNKQLQEEHDEKKLNDKFGSLRSDPDIDEQLLIKLQFTEKVKIQSIRFEASVPSYYKNDKEAGVSGPAQVLVFVNNLNLTFADVDTTTPTDEFRLKKDDLLKGTELKVKYVKYQSVDSICLFIKRNIGKTPITEVNFLEITGFAVESMKVNNIKPASYF
jgi:hypothetical protein